jgi:hypothetical protein
VDYFDMLVDVGKVFVTELAEFLSWLAGRLLVVLLSMAQQHGFLRTH